MLQNRADDGNHVVTATRVHLLALQNLSAFSPLSKMAKNLKTPVTFQRKVRTTFPGAAKPRGSGDLVHLGDSERGPEAGTEGSPGRTWPPAAHGEQLAAPRPGTPGRAWRHPGTRASAGLGALSLERLEAPRRPAVTRLPQPVPGGGLHSCPSHPGAHVSLTASLPEASTEYMPVTPLLLRVSVCRESIHIYCTGAHFY